MNQATEPLYRNYKVMAVLHEVLNNLLTLCLVFLKAETFQIDWYVKRFLCMWVLDYSRFYTMVTFYLIQNGTT